MSLKKAISKYATYNHWANQTLTQWLKTLKEPLIHQQTPSSFSTINETLRHMADSQLFWLAIITETQAETETQTQAPKQNDVFNTLLATSQQIIDKCEQYTEEELLKQIPSTDMIQSRYEYILHLINHNTYHRGQIITMSRCLGTTTDIPPLDYEVFLWSSR